MKRGEANGRTIYYPSNAVFVIEVKRGNRYVMQAVVQGDLDKAVAKYKATTGKAGQRKRLTSEHIVPKLILTEVFDSV